MGYYIFFDESGKIDRQKNKYSYYGALGIKKSEHKFMNDTFLTEEIENYIFKSLVCIIWKNTLML